MPSSDQEQERARAAGAARAGPGKAHPATSATRPVASWLTAAAALGVLTTGLLLWSSWRGPEPAHPTASLQTQQLPLSPQECVTECQARQTDCIQACEGHVSCEKACVVVGEACVARCRHATDAGVRPPAAAPSPAPP